MSHRTIRWTVAVVLFVGMVGGNVAIVVYYATRPWDPARPERTPLIEELIEQLADGNADIRRSAATQLCERGPEAQAALPRLRQLLDDKDAHVRITAATAIWAIDRQADPVLLALWEARGKNIGNCEMQFALAADDDTADALRAIYLSFFELPQIELKLTGFSIQRAEGAKERAEKAVAALAQGLQHEHYGVRRMAAMLLSMNRSPELTQTVVPELLLAVADEDLWVRLFAVLMLGEIGPPARPALPAIRGLVENRMSRRAAAIAAFFGAAPGNPILLPMLAEKIAFEDRIGEAAAASLHQIAP